jgi:hypothetical protein
VDDILENAQRFFYALKMAGPQLPDLGEEDAGLEKREIDDAVDETPVADIVDGPSGKIKVGICHNIYNTVSAEAYVDNFKLYLPNFVSIEDNKSISDFNIFYSPVKKSVVLENLGSSNRIKSLKVYNISGSVVESYNNIDETRYELSAPLVKGIYIVKMETTEGNPFAKKVVIY